MGWIIGMDEAGYGPNLGPLVLAATVWEVPGSPQATDLWSAFGEVAAREPSDDLVQLHIADSKEVYSPSIGLGALERGVLAALGVVSRVPSELQELFEIVGACAAEREATRDHARDLWFDDAELPLPLTELGSTAQSAAARWTAVCGANGIRLHRVQVDVVTPRRWNQATRSVDNKSTALSRLSLQLLRRVWDPDGGEPTLIFADKHGGRNRYAMLLTQCLDGRMVWCGRESRESSVYKLGNTEIRFEAKAERHFPVAMASMVAKYVRELAMELFNRFWLTHLPALKPTHGYPTDASRFRRDVDEVRSRLAIPDDVFWRER